MMHDKTASQDDSEGKKNKMEKVTVKYNGLLINRQNTFHFNDKNKTNTRLCFHWFRRPKQSVVKKQTKRLNL